MQNRSHNARTWHKNVNAGNKHGLAPFGPASQGRLAEIVRSPSPLDSEDSVVCLEDLDAETLDRAEHTAAGALQSAPSAPSQAEAEDLAKDRLVAQSAAADLAPDQAAPIDDAIDHITAQLAAFCFEQLERSVMSRDALDLNADRTAVEDEFQVRYCIAAIARRQYIQDLQFRSFPECQITRKDLLQI
jgi:hypothetical protein